MMRDKQQEGLFDRNNSQKSIFNAQVSKVHEYRKSQHQIVKKLLKERYVETMRDYNTKKVSDSGQDARFNQEMKKPAF